MKILTNFLGAPDSMELPDGRSFEFLKGESWADFRRQLPGADLVVVNCGDALLYRMAARFLLMPWTKRPLVAVDLVLRRPTAAHSQVAAGIKRLLLAQVTHFIHYFRDISGYTKYFGISQAKSSFVPFKVNNMHLQVRAEDIGEDYVFTMGRSLRDYDTFIRAVAELPYPAAIPQFSFESFEGKSASFHWDAGNIPGNLRILPDKGGREDLIRNLARARVVVIPTQASSICASGLSTYLDAMYLGKCVVISEGPCWFHPMMCRRSRRPYSGSGKTRRYGAPPPLRAAATRTLSATNPSSCNGSSRSRWRRRFHSSARR
jgi:hypothetical protein